MSEARFINGFGPRLIALGVLGLTGWAMYALYQAPSGGTAMAASGAKGQAFSACIAARGQVFDEIYAAGRMTKEQLVTARARLAPVCRLEANRQN